MPSPLSSTTSPSSLLLGAALLLLTTAVTSASIQDVRPDYSARSQATTQPPRIEPPAPDAAQFALASFRVKGARSCERHSQCLNGGRCQRRLRRCECPLGYDGANCEHPDIELLAGAQDSETVPAHQSRRPDAANDDSSLRLADWLFYVPLAASLLLLLCAFARVAVTLLASSAKRAVSSNEKKHSLPVLHDDDVQEEASSAIYTLPLPVRLRPPPLCSEQPSFLTSTTAEEQTLQQLQPEYVTADDSDCEYSEII